MKTEKISATKIIPAKGEAFETLALAEKHVYHHPGNIPIPSEENVISAKAWVDENEK